MMPRVRSFARLLASLALLVSWTAGGWAAACAQGAVTSADALEHEPRHGMHAMAHHGMHGAMRHHAPSPSPDPKPGERAPRGEMPACPLLVMNGGSCLGAAQLPSVVAVSAPHSAEVSGYPAADDIHDRLLPLSLFRPPEA